MMRTMSAMREALVRLEVFLELAALDELHRDVPDAVVLAEIVDRDDVGMVEASRRLRLAAKARDHGRRVFAGKLVGADRLQRDDALDHRIVAFVDDAHRAAADLAPDFVLAECADVCHASLPARKRRRRRERRRRVGRASAVTCTWCRFPRPTSARAAAPSCRATRRPAATGDTPRHRRRLRADFHLFLGVAGARPARSSRR